MRRLAEKPPEPETLAAVLTLLHQMARLFAGRMLSAADAAGAFGEMSGALERLLKP